MHHSWPSVGATTVLHGKRFMAVAILKTTQVEFQAHECDGLLNPLGLQSNSLDGSLREKSLLNLLSTLKP